MKECCKVGDENSPNRFKRWIGWIIWMGVLFILIGVALVEIFSIK